MKLSVQKHFVQFSVIYFMFVNAAPLVSECDRFGTCTQKCKVVAAMSRCFCMEGYELTNNKTCTLKESNWKLVYASKNQVVSFSIAGMVRSNLTTNSDGDFDSVTSDARNEVVYWTDAAFERGAVYKASVMGNGKPEVVANVGINNPSEIVFDWITGNLYFIDSGSIVVCSQNPTRCVVVINENGTRPYGIALHPNAGIMFWITAGKVLLDDSSIDSVIMKAGMDGSTPTAVISTGQKWPNLIFTVDETNSRIYWARIFGNKIESSRLDGSDRQDYFVSGYPFSIHILGDRIFWSDVATETIKSANKFTGKGETIILANCSSRALSLVHVAMQPKLRVNPCEDNVKNTHICVLSGNGAQYLCPAEMVEDGSKCVGDDENPKLLLAEGDMLYAAGLNIIGKYVFEQILLPSQIKMINALVYNPINKTIIISDAKQKILMEYNLKWKMNRVLVGNVNVISMDIDMIGENLVWIDGATQTIEVLSLRTLARLILRRNVENSRDIIFAPGHGTLYLSKTGKANNGNVSTECEEINTVFLDLKSKNAQFYQCMDCTSPIKLTYDQKTDNVVLALSKISKLDIQSGSTGWYWNAFSSLTSGVSDHPVMDVVKIGNQIFWVDQSNQVTFVNPDKNDIFHKIPTDFSNQNSSSSLVFRKVLALINPGMVDDVAKLRENHDCSPKKIMNKPCSHICLPTGIDTVGKCWCPVGFHLDADGLSCIETKGNEAVIIAVYIILTFVGLVGITILVAYFWERDRSFPMLYKPRKITNS